MIGFRLIANIFKTLSLRSVWNLNGQRRAFIDDVAR